MENQEEVKEFKALINKVKKFFKTIEVEHKIDIVENTPNVYIVFLTTLDYRLKIIVNTYIHIDLIIPVYYTPYSRDKRIWTNSERMPTQEELNVLIQIKDYI